MSTPPGAIEIIARVVALRGDRVLLCRDTRHSYSYLPGGHVEFDEPAAAACEREFLEETGMAVVAGQLLLVAECRFIQEGRQRHEINLVFHVEHRDGKWPEAVPSREKNIEFLWAPRRELRTLDFRPRSIGEWLEDHDDQCGGAAWLASTEPR